MGRNTTTAKTTADRPPGFHLDPLQLWAAAARTGMDPVTTKAIAEHIGVHTSTLSRVLSGQRRMPLSMVAAINAAFPEAFHRIARPTAEDGHVLTYRGAR